MPQYEHFLVIRMGKKVPRMHTLPIFSRDTEDIDAWVCGHRFKTEHHIVATFIAAGTFFAHTGFRIQLLGTVASRIAFGFAFAVLGNGVDIQTSSVALNLIHGLGGIRNDVNIDSG